VKGGPEGRKKVMKKGHMAVFIQSEINSKVGNVKVWG